MQTAYECGKNRTGAPRRIGLISLHAPGLLTDEMEATLDLVKGGAAWSNALDDLITERVVYLQLVGAITESQGTPRNGTNIAIMHVLDTTRIKGQKCLNTPGYWAPSVAIQTTRHIITVDLSQEDAKEAKLHLQK